MKVEGNRQGNPLPRSAHTAAGFVSLNSFDRQICHMTQHLRQLLKRFRQLGSDVDRQEAIAKYKPPDCLQNGEPATPIAKP